MFGHLVSKQAQVTGGGAMPSRTLESPLIISRARALASKSTPARRSREPRISETSLLCSDVCIHFRPVHAQAAVPEMFSSLFEVVIAPPMCPLIKLCHRSAGAGDLELS